ncbi:tRNA synthetase RNA-binding protein [Thermosipho melanesiensis]|uniref:RNA-binding S4 domain protein n=2 Tax=Thermosipho melanesiensis TaxID=46541 RepID=A6LMS6_THEM4|nr:S4 domain-containing protein [Thermosipho melanesiensis]ABR31227.1 RNA-binding S4 domain protein [Thermosipho melanesiensis BI429]APT74311.1 tRNA synthetase RNA-binding protein [Thermosipho melanesiensis]OOC36252.1 tRNA synthetase RNA-binding protein [Thermosipho melanesiensis]OOC37070.1 tRNA synthetase RNA-binding protein [Thermosipho melanesiensis]OOC37822.1 tRNA synthetase RNA-binding protein [Thermosipho melanesiensis]
MRLDKFLKESRIIKRRTIAQQIAKNGKVFRNGYVLKPSSEVKMGDILDIFLKNRHIKVKVLSDKEYELIEEEKGEDL